MTVSEFERENRYIVIKRSDLEKVPVSYRNTMINPMFNLLPHLPKREFVVIESDWPEYETVWRMLEDRVTGVSVKSCDECMGTGGIGRLETCSYCKGTGKTSIPAAQSELAALQSTNKRLNETIQRMVDQTIPLVPDESNPMWSRRITIDELQVELAALREELAALDNDNTRLTKETDAALDRADAAEQRNAELVELLRDVKRHDPDTQCMSYPMHRRIDAALKPRRIGSKRMIIKATGADPIYIGLAVWAACTQNALWAVFVPLIIASWFFSPRWDRENGWRFLHGE